MKIPAASDIKAWDQFTIEQEPVKSIDLMERAAKACYQWLEENGYTSRHLTIFCGKGNNGGDGLALARMLLKKKNPVTVYILEPGNKGSDDFQQNLARLHKLTPDIRFIQSEEQFHEFAFGEVIIDALFGSGLNRPLEGIAAQLADHLNNSGCEIISIDIASGLFADQSSQGYTTVQPRHTLSFQVYKLAFMMAENALATGQVHLLDIGLHERFYNDLLTTYEITGKEIMKAVYKQRNRFAHKGHFGHAALVAGSTGMMGAAVLAAEGCMRAGVGKLTAYIPKTGYEIMQTTIPEAMSRISGFKDYVETVEGLSYYDAVGVGPGIGLYESHHQLLRLLLLQCEKPMVIDADAITILSENKDYIREIPPYSILTPHPKEFDRLFGPSAHDFERTEKARQMAREHKLVIVLKGHHTLIATPGGKGFFNSTGNAGMATGGSGDVLTGILTALLAQGYGAVEAALLGVYLHGLAGDFAAKDLSMEAMIAGDLPAYLGHAFQSLAVLE